MSDEPITPDPGLNALESALKALAPARARVDRDRVMFRAGQASVRQAFPGRKGWMTLAASLALVALGEGAMLALRPSPRVVEKLIVIREPAGHSSPAPVAIRTPAAGSFRSLKTDHERRMWQVLLYGLDGLPATPATARADRQPRPGASRNDLREELRKDFDLGDPS